ncbi:alpha/beta hydrolase [Leifsonia sp. NPDC080035]|uniref:Alpha/beta hydrolase n=1 Tax=Leifsonia sp. NPDC080035 TaxID=3143936 RepID=A0AAU7GHI9_9MICO
MRFTREQLLVEVDEETVREARAFYAKRPSGRGPASEAELRDVRALRAATTPSDPPPAVEVVAAGGRSVPVRIFTPAGGRARGVHLDIHGGGFYMDSAARNDVRNRDLADRLGFAVVSVDYRLAPEHPWPAAPDDCETAALWLAEHAAERFGTSRLSVGGHSSGATLAMTTLLRLRDRGVRAYRGGVLEAGTWDLSARTPWGSRIADEYFLEAYLGPATDRSAPDVSPLFADLHGLPPILIVIGENDVVLEDNLAMAGRLAVAGVELELRVYPVAPHGFVGHGTALARTAREQTEQWMAAVG